MLCAMATDHRPTLTAYADKLEQVRSYLQLDVKRQRLAELQQQAGASDLWDDPARAQKVMGELASVEDDLRVYDDFAGKLDDLSVLNDLAREEDDEATANEVAEGLTGLQSALSDLETRVLLSDEH